MHKIYSYLLFSLIVSLLTSCSESEDSINESDGMLKVNLNGIKPLNEGLIYEGWIIVDSKPISLGRFNPTSTTTEQTFSISSANSASATSFILSIEEENNQNLVPSATKILIGDFIEGIANLSFENAVGFIIDPSIEYNLHCNTITPTDGTTDPRGSDEQYGIWFQNSLGPGLYNIPVLNEGWKYEGWVVFNGTIPLSTGKFTSYQGPDESSYYSGTFPGNDYPGEDFLENLPAGVSGYVPGSTVMITIEPDLISDLDSQFFIKPISGIAVGGLSGTHLEIIENFNATITGTATIIN